MSDSSIYRVHGPSAWPESPKWFSFSSLAAIEVCLLQWQLMHARYGDLARFPARPHPAAVEGKIVHETLDLLFKSMALAGLPELGTTEFRREVSRVDVRGTVDRLIDEHQVRLTTHPRGAGFRLRVGAQQLVNQAIRLFRAEYSTASAGADSGPVSVVGGHHASTTKMLSGEELLQLLRRRGALSELRLEHPSLPFVGIIDLVRIADDGIVILDFKTGQLSASHEAQVLAYAILWWRNTNQPPVRIEVRYPHGVESRSVNHQALADGERELGRRIDQVAESLSTPPAPARLGGHCRYCDVRQFCDAYWAVDPAGLATKKARNPKSIDIELTVEGPPSIGGFSARGPSGFSCAVVHAPDGSKVHGPFVAGEGLRILNARRAATENAIELMPWTEVFHG